MNSKTPRTLPRLFAAALLLTALTSLTACSDDNSPMGPTAPPHATTVTDGALSLTVGTDKASYDFGETITITSTLTNTSNAPVDLDFARGTPARFRNININANDADNVNHYAQAEGEADQMTLGAGKSISYTYTWDQVSRRTRRPVDRGTFEIISSVGFDDRDSISARRLFVLLR